MICRLCNKTVPKLVNSHIVSEFLYQGMYDGKHRFNVISSNVDIDDRLLQKGLREPLLCERCDNELLAGYEKYAQGVIYGGEVVQTAVDGNNLRFRGLDYSTLRLFYLSLLWRMSVSKHKFFNGVSLGPYEAHVAQMLLAGNPGTPSEFGVLCVAPVFDSQQVADWMMPPDCIKQFGRRVYRCLIGGLLYCFFVGRAPLPAPLETLFLQPDGSWVIRREKIEKIAFLADWCVTLGKAIAERQLQGRDRN